MFSKYDANNLAYTSGHLPLHSDLPYWDYIPGVSTFVINVFAKMVYLLGDFRVAFRLCFKASPSAKPLIWKLFYSHVNVPKFASRKCNLEIAY